MNPAHHKEIGDQVIGGIITVPADVDRVPDLRPEHLPEDKHRDALRAVKAIRARSGDDAACSPVLIADEAGLDLTVIQGFIDSCHHADIEALVGRLIEHAEHFTLQGQVGDLWRAVSEDDKDRTRALISELRAPSSRSNGWEPENIEAALAKVANGERLVDEPSILATDSRRAIFHPGTIAGVAAPAESGKGILVARVIGDVIQAGGHAIYLDFEESAERRIVRQTSMGIPEAHIRRGFTYLRPTGPVGDTSRLDALIRPETQVAVIDAVNPAMQAEGLSFMDNDEIGAWINGYPRHLQRKGLLVILVDHVVKAREDRGRSPIGGVQKLNEVDLQLMLKVTQPLGRGQVGKVEIEWTKDRLGFWGRGHHADMVVKSTGDSMTVTIEERITTRTDFRPTGKMEQVSKAVEAAPGITIRDLRDQIGGRATVTDDARHALVKDGYLAEQKEGRKTVLFSVRPYREIGGTHNALCPDIGTRSETGNGPNVSQESGHAETYPASEESTVGGNVSQRVPTCPGPGESECVPVSVSLKDTAGTRSPDRHDDGEGREV